MLIKRNETHGLDTRVVLASNYLSAIALGWLFVLANGVEGISRQTFWLGLGGGMLWPLTFYLLMWGIREYGLSLAGAVSRLSLSIPILFSLLFLKETFSFLTALGIFSTFVAFFLLSPLKSEKDNTLDIRALWYFPLLVVTFGLVDGWANVFNTIAPPAEKYLFMVLIFTFAGALMWSGLLVVRITITRQAFVQGVLLGVPNFLSTYFLLESLQTPFFAGRTAVAYTLFSVIGVTLAFGAGVLIWKEKITPGNAVGFAWAVCAIILLNLA